MSRLAVPPCLVFLGVPEVVLEELGRHSGRLVAEREFCEWTTAFLTSYNPERWKSTALSRFHALTPPSETGQDHIYLRLHLGIPLALRNGTVDPGIDDVWD
jgi:hypothetical protein